MMRILLDNPITIKGEPSGLESVQLEEITVLENHRVPSPQITSLGTIPTQPNVSRMPGERGVPNPLFDLVTIHDDEESSEASLVNLVLIIEEKEPEKASSPSLDDPVQNLYRAPIR
jgi:hypothetical protein